MYVNEFQKIDVEMDVNAYNKYIQCNKNKKWIPMYNSNCKCIYRCTQK